MATFGLEEEVFVVDPEKPSLKSLYYLTKLLWRDPKFNYYNTASNFSRGRDMIQSLMSGVEVATGIHSKAASAVSELKARRRELDGVVTDGLIVPIGHLINLVAPTNVCALQFHIGGVKDQEKTYRNLLHFLPVLVLMTINAPYAGREYKGQSYRMAASFAIGPILPDKTDRFQDMIVSKRLKTIEIRVFDPVWDIRRVETLANAIEAVVALKQELKPDISRYNVLRSRIARNGYIRELKPIYDELKQIADVPEEMLVKTASDEIKEMYEDVGLLATYSAMDNGYRTGVFEHRRIPDSKSTTLKAAAGLAGYYMPKLPYVLYKYIRES